MSACFHCLFWVGPVHSFTQWVLVIFWQTGHRQPPWPSEMLNRNLHSLHNFDITYIHYILMIIWRMKNPFCHKNQNKHSRWRLIHQLWASDGFSTIVNTKSGKIMGISLRVGSNRRLNFCLKHLKIMEIFIALRKMLSVFKRSPAPSK